jgi:transposase
MSLPNFDSQASLFSTAALSGQLFAPTDRFAIFARVIYPLVVKTRAKLAKAYCANNGRPAVEPVLMAGVSLLQFLEGAPDRQAVELLRYHAGWNFALNRSIGDALFDPSALVYFRRRLVEHDLSPVVFAELLEGLMQAGLVQRRGKQRLDATQMMGLVSAMSRLEIVRETLRLALEELAKSASAASRPEFWSLLMERYVESKLDYRSTADALKSKMEQAGADALALLGWAENLAPKDGAGPGPQVQLLRRVFEENFQVVENELSQHKAQPPGSVQNPHDPEAQWSTKGAGKHKKEHVGYKVQVAETVQDAPLAKGEPTPNFLTAIVTQPAISSDDAGLDDVAQEQAAMGLAKPTELYVDAGYVSAERIVQAQAEGRELIGPAKSSPQRGERFPSEAFAVDIAQRQATCPAGHLSTNCSRLEEEKTGKITYRLEWVKTLCANCVRRAHCLGKDQTHRTLVVGQHHDALQARRQEQKTDVFKEKMKRRNALEGSQSELVRAHGLRRARYRGHAKARLQNYFIGAACNAKRWIKRIQWQLRQAALNAAGAAGLTLQSA